MIGCSEVAICNIVFVFLLEHVLLSGRILFSRVHVQYKIKFGFINDSVRDTTDSNTIIRYLSTIVC